MQNALPHEATITQALHSQTGKLETSRKNLGYPSKGKLFPSH